MFREMRKHNRGMALRPQDLVVALKLAVSKVGTYPELAADLELSLSEAHGAVKRATLAGLLVGDRQVNRAALLEFVVHGVKYAFHAKRGRVTRGIPTAHGALPLKDKVGKGSDPIPVWPDPAGEARGESFEPLYRSAPAAARKDERLYELLCLIDALRGGQARERNLAEQRIREILQS